MYEVIYFSATGNTRKVAEAIADELGLVARAFARSIAQSLQAGVPAMTAV